MRHMRRTQSAEALRALPMPFATSSCNRPNCHHDLTQPLNHLVAAKTVGPFVQGDNVIKSRLGSV
eukprot:7210777-Pyramimonas_sp.AAC.1